jgi:hypothetical protein
MSHSKSELIDAKSIELLKKKIREVSVSRLKLHAGIEKLQLVEIIEPPVVHAHWMALIFAGGRELRVTLKAYFMSEDACKLAASTYGNKLTSTQVADFVKEFCNLVIGTMKIYLDLNSIKVGASLPMTARGFDEVFFPEPAGALSFSDSWRLQSEGAKLDLGVTFEVNQAIKIIHDLKLDEPSSSDVEFL